MEWIVWDDALDTGHARMDADHKEMAQLFNRLRDAVEGGEGEAACARVFGGIIEHARGHFELEERLMARYRYPKLEQHASEHAMLLRQALDYAADFNADTAGSRAELMRFAEVWLEFHILFSDKALAAFLARTPQQA